MVSLKSIDKQLVRVGMKNKFFGRPEVRELTHILAPRETINHAVMGHYEGGFALLVATDHRILLIDKKPWFLTLEDVRYDMVSEVDFFARLLDSSLCLNLLNKKLTFTSWQQKRLRKMVHYIQHRVMNSQEVNHQIQQSHFEEVAEHNAQQPSTTTDNDFAASFNLKMKQHSFAHLAGQIAVDIAQRRPIIKPLYPRPSLVARYGRASAASSTKKAS